MREKGNLLKKRIKLLTTVSIISIILAILAIISCCIIVIYGFMKLNTTESDSGIVNSQEINPTRENTTDTDTETEASDQSSTPIEFEDTATNSKESNTLETILLDAQNSDNISADKLLYDIKNALAQGDSTTALFRKLYPDDIVVASGNGYTFFPINKELKLNEKPDDVDLDDPKLLKGIDVSRYQGEIDWEAVAKDEIDYAIIRLGIRGYSEGGLIIDDNYEVNMDGAKENNISTGVYFFTQATSDEEAIEEAEFVIENLKKYKIQWPVYLDVEYIDGTGRGDKISVEDRTQYATIFLDRVKKAGYNVGIYGNLKTYITMVDMARLQNYDIWLAAYSYPIYFPYHYDMLQHTEKGNINGIPTIVDLNVSWKSY